jgi:hypothetical protein
LENSRRFREGGEPPSSEEVDRAIRVACVRYQPALDYLPYKFRDFVDVVLEDTGYVASITERGWTWVTNQISLDKSPGYPWTHHGATNFDFFSDHAAEVRSLVGSRLTSLLRVSYDCCCDSSNSGTCPHIRLGTMFDFTSVFIKSEPTKRAKIEQGRMRHIDPCGVIDAIVERLLHGPLNFAEIQARFYGKNIPSQPGFDVTRRKNCDALTEHVKSFGQSAFSDMSGWDTTVQPWEQWADLELRRRLLKEETDGGWYRIARMHMICLMRSVYVLSDGRIYMPLDSGMWSSGRYCTSAGNSHMRFILSAVVQARLGVQMASINAITMGDDCVECCPDTELAIGEYAKLGHDVKMMVPASTSFEFISHEFSFEGADPHHVGFDKVLLNFLVQECPRDALDSHLNAWFNQEEKCKFRQFYDRRWRSGDGEIQCKDPQTSGPSC